MKAIKLERHTRFELVTSTLARLRSTNWASVAMSLLSTMRAIKLERHTRFELVTSTLARLRSTNWASVAMSLLSTMKAIKLERHTRFELVTSTLARLRSTNWASVAYSQKRIGCGGRIWTDDLRVMSPTSYQAAPPRVRISLLSTMRAIKLERHTRFELVTSTLARLRSTNWASVAYSQKRIGCGSRIWTDDLRVMSPTSYQAAPSRVRISLLSTMRAIKLERHTRFELVTSTLARLRSTNWASVALVAGAGFEPTTFGLWARRATKLLHPASVFHC